MGAFDDLIPDGKPAAGAFDDLLPSKAGKRSAGAFDDLVPERPSILKMVALENPLTAIAETGMNLASQAVALPVAGLAGLATEAGNALGMTDRKGADVVHQVGEAMTYQPRGELGKATTELATYPFQKLAEAGQWAGGKTLEATDSPALATAVDTTIQGVLPMVIGPAAKAGKSRITGKVETAPEAIATEAQATNAGAAVAEAARPADGALVRDSVNRIEGLTNEHTPPAAASTSGIQRLAEHESALLQPEAQAMGSIRRGGDSSLPGMAEQLRDVPEGRRTEAQPAASAIAQGIDQGLLPGERSLGDAGFVGRPEDAVTRRTVEGGRTTGLEGREGYRSDSIGTSDHARQRTDQLRTVERQAPILDPNSGPLSRSAAIARPDLVIKANEVKPAGPFADLLPGGRAAKGDVQRGPAAPGTEYSFAPGANYAPLIDDARAPLAAADTAVGRGKPIRREEIIIPFAKDLGASIYTGRVNMKNALGFFRRGNEEVCIKRHADLEVTAHEMAHLIDSRVPAISNAWRSDKALRAELKSVSYDLHNVKEGFAEGVRLWMTQPEVLQQRAPLVYEWLTRFAADDAKYGPAMRKAQEGMIKWFSQDAIDRARSKIGDHRPLSDAMNGAFDRFRQSVSDDLHGVMRMERELNGKLDPVGAYESARLSRASASIADGAVRFGYPVKNADGSFTYRGKGLQDIMKPVAERLDDALLYFVGRSANELLLQGREHLFTKGEIKGMLALETPEARKAFAEYQAWNRGVLDFAEAQGVLNPETRAKWKRVEYLPFSRVEQPGGLKGKPGDWAGIQALTGGTENIKDVLGNMIGNAAQLIDVAVKNEARQKIAELASKPGGGKFMAKIDPGSRPVKVGGSQVLDEMFKRYGIAIDGDAPAFFQFMLHNQPPAGGNVVAVLKSGKPVWYEVADPILYRSLQAIDRPPMQWLTKWLGMPKRVGQAAITLTPDFMLANIARDTIMGSVMSRSGFRPVIDSLQGMRLRMSEDPLYKDYIANGGGLSSMYLDEQHVRTKLEKFYTKQGVDYRTVLDTPDKLLGFVETLADAFEMSTRLGEYNRAIQAGEHPRHAAYQGREVSTDFAMRGDSKALGFMYDTVMFLRPAVVSMDRLYRGVAHDPNKAAIGAKTAMLALSSVGLYLLNREDPRYQDLNDWDRDANWHFFVGDQHFRYPKIWEIGAVASVAERTTEKLMHDDPTGLGKDFARIIGNTFSLNYMPQIVAPLVEQATNRNSFTKAPIETPGMENVQPFLRAKPNTSETMKALGMASRNLPESLQVPPARAEALLRGYLNTWGMYGLMLSDRAFFGDKLPETRTDQMPVIRRFYSQEPPQHTKFETQFYDMLGEAKRLQGTLRDLDRMGRPDIADQKEQSPLAGESKPLERANKNLQGINSEMRDVRRAADLTPEEKRQRLDGLTVERNQLLKDAVQAAKAAQANR
ncbi:MAG: LPD38 domain-containing protein [Sulfuricella sp.]